MCAIGTFLEQSWDALSAGFIGSCRGARSLENKSHRTHERPSVGITLLCEGPGPVMREGVLGEWKSDRPWGVQRREPAGRPRSEWCGEAGKEGRRRVSEPGGRWSEQ